MNYLIFILLGFLSGSMMYSEIVPYLLTGRTITAISDDQNPGCGNVFKHAGIFQGILCLLLDLCKGIFPVWVSLRFCSTEHLLFGLVLAAPTAGHASSFCLAKAAAKRKFQWMNHTRGKAIAVSFGCLIGLLPASPLVFALVVPFVFFSTLVRIHPHACRVVASFGCFLLTGLIRHSSPAFWLGSLLISLMVIFRHLESFRCSDQSFHVTIGFSRKSAK